MLLRTILTAVFAATGVYCLDRCAGPRRRSVTGVGRANYAAHVAMAVSMIAMLWMPLRLAAWQMLVFSVGCAWFLVQATGVGVLTTAAYAMGRDWTSHVGPGRLGAARLRCLHHAAVMAGMAWMVDAMARMGGGLPAMAGMNVSARGAGRGTAAVVGGYYLVAAVLLAADGARRGVVPGHAGRVDDGCHASMTLGMGVLVLMMA